ncbi:MAG: hypothetical protein V1822_03095 [Candidatus Micrarchaeota archaeon]
MNFGFYTIPDGVGNGKNRNNGRNGTPNIKEFSVEMLEFSELMKGNVNNQLGDAGKWANGNGRIEREAKRLSEKYPASEYEKEEISAKIVGEYSFGQAKQMRRLEKLERIWDDLHILSLIGGGAATWAIVKFWPAEQILDYVIGAVAGIVVGVASFALIHKISKGARRRVMEYRGMAAVGMENMQNELGKIWNAFESIHSGEKADGGGGKKY